MYHTPTFYGIPYVSITFVYPSKLDPGLFWVFNSVCRSADVACVVSLTPQTWYSGRGSLRTCLWSGTVWVEVWVGGTRPTGPEERSHQDYL